MGATKFGSAWSRFSLAPGDQKAVMSEHLLVHDAHTNVMTTKISITLAKIDLLKGYILHFLSNQPHRRRRRLRLSSPELKIAPL